MDPNSVSTKLIKKSLDVTYYGWASSMRAIGSIDFAVPSFSSMHKTSSKTIKHYHESGMRSAMPIITAAREHGVALTGNRVLDFGCGVARQLLHFTRHLPENQYFACDIDNLSIEFIRKHYPQVDAYVSQFQPPLKYEADFFDLIYSVSIFSHLHTDDVPPWLDELARITKPGGLMLLTTEGPSSLKPLAEVFGASETHLREKLAADGVLYKEYDYLEKCLQKQDTLKSASLLVGVQGSYGSTVFSPAYIREHWNSDRIEVVSIIEGVIDFRQDLVVLRRR